jgi:serine/threonine protein kinase
MMYMAPEEWGFNEKSRGISEKADVYALALIINEMLTRRRPWRVPPGGYAFACIAMELQEGNRPWIDPQTPVEMQNLIKRMWSEDPHRRPSASDVVKILERMIEQELQRIGVPLERKRSIGTSVDTEYGMTL